MSWETILDPERKTPRKWEASVPTFTKHRTDRICCQAILKSAYQPFEDTLADWWKSKD